MALPPAASADPTATDPTAGMGADPSMGASDETVEVTITMKGDGSYMVYAGDEPDSGGADMSGDDADAMGPAGAAPAAAGAAPTGGNAGAAGQPADSVGSALKLAMDILNASKSSEGAPGNSDDQLAAGFSSDKSPTPATSMKQKYG